jgi:hypothetical protein
LKEWGNQQDRPANAKELFNLRHSSLRNAIERIFGVVKKRFPILSLMPSYPLQIQRDLVIAIFLIHNCIRNNQEEDDIDGAATTNDNTNDVNETEEADNQSDETGMCDCIY